MNDEKFFGEIAKTLTPILYSDFKSWAGSLGNRVKKAITNAKMRTYANPQDLLADIEANNIISGDKVRVHTIPSPFGPFLRKHFITPFIGEHTSMRLGPKFVSSNPVMSIMAQASSHLTPVGLYPLVSQDVHQCCLYPPDAEACGFIGIIPGVSQLVPYLFSLFSSEHARHFGYPSLVTGNLRFVDAGTFASAGFTIEEYEIIRQVGNVWFLDVTGEDSQVIPDQRDEYQGLWGGLYASGHLEIVSGSLALSQVVDAFQEALEREGFKGNVQQNQAGRREIAIYAKGIRATIDSTNPFWSIHMDAEISHDFGTYREAFDLVTSNAIQNLQELARANSVELQNANDLDFTYTNSTNAFSVLKSLGAESIHDPLAIAIRDWHRDRGL